MAVPLSPMRAAATRRPVLVGGAVHGRDGFERAKAAAVLRRGATGTAVRNLQLKLVARGYLSRADFSAGSGVFGPRTETAVKRLQIERGLSVTGVADGPTLAAASLERVAPRAANVDGDTDVFEAPPVTLSAAASKTVTDDDEPTASTAVGAQQLW
ncbi:MAG: peptidoglycan-binding protein [Myxococcaceae bacterium]|jgi:peptidoglycan hydrolase-like protein with peptidoglycan-binding domain|nr:peptidoglycan-binding protein [Myxococcaceae bacterium]MCA3012577.1 peptidoglycan-binding protein [Myxococcaceae bacterium]